MQQSAPCSNQNEVIRKVKPYQPNKHKQRGGVYKRSGARVSFAVSDRASKIFAIADNAYSGRLKVNFRNFEHHGCRTGFLMGLSGLGEGSCVGCQCSESQSECLNLWSKAIH